MREVSRHLDFWESARFRHFQQLKHIDEHRLQPLPSLQTVMSEQEGCFRLLEREEGLHSRLVNDEKEIHSRLMKEEEEHHFRLLQDEWERHSRSMQELLSECYQIPRSCHDSLKCKSEYHRRLVLIESVRHLTRVTRLRKVSTDRRYLWYHIQWGHERGRHSRRMKEIIMDEHIEFPQPLHDVLERENEQRRRLLLIESVRHLIRVTELRVGGVSCILGRKELERDRHSERMREISERLTRIPPLSSQGDV